MNSTIIPIFYACDDNFVRYTAVSIRSMMDHADMSRQYRIHILNTSISEVHKKEILAMQNAQFTITFENVTTYADRLNGKLPIRDYYTKTTYFRLFISEMFPNYEKAIYIDSDTVVLGNIAELYDHELGDHYVGAAHEQAMVQVNEYGTYVEEVCGVDRNQYFNAGVLLINCQLFRQKHILERFVQLLSEYNFVVTQDEDYLNILCKDHVLWLSQAWNCEVFGKLLCTEEEMCIIHYIMTSKPWHYEDCRLGQYFWTYAEKTSMVDSLRAECAGYSDAEKERDAVSCDRLLQTAIRETAREDAYYKQVKKKYSADRVEVLERIQDLESRGIFDVDVENDPPARELKPDEIEYTRKGICDRIKTAVAFSAAKRFVHKLISHDQMIIKDIVGIEHFASLESGAVITCNHFNAFDSFAIHMAYMASGQKKRKFFRVIREGNYTGFPGFYGFLMRNCNTLPLSSNVKTMGKFIKGVNQILREGHFVLFYPEQSMWWNYRKPKPLKNGAFQFASMNKVPVLPCFITMCDSDIKGEDGFYVQEYTIHVGTPIWPNESLSARDNVLYMKDENFRQWKEIYETTYGIPLCYRTNQGPVSEEETAEAVALGKTS